MQIVSVKMLTIVQSAINASPTLAPIFNSKFQADVVVVCAMMMRLSLTL